MAFLEIYRASDEDFDIQVYEADGVTPLNIAGADLTFVASYRYRDTEPLFEKTSEPDGGITIVDAEEGIARVRVTAEDTAPIPIRAMLVWALKAEDVAGVRHVLRAGRMRVKPNVPNEVPGS